MSAPLLRAVQHMLAGAMLLPRLHAILADLPGISDTPLVFLAQSTTVFRYP